MQAAGEAQRAGMGARPEAAALAGAHLEEVRPEAAVRASPEVVAEACRTES